MNGGFFFEFKKNHPATLQNGFRKNESIITQLGCNKHLTLFTLLSTKLIPSSTKSLIHVDHGIHLLHLGFDQFHSRFQCFSLG